MKKPVLILAILLSTCFIYAQGPGGKHSNLSSGSNGLGDSGYGTNNFMNLNIGKWVKDPKKNTIDKGSNYLFPTWIQNAIVYDLNGKAYKLANCNFNVKLNRLEAILDDESTVDNIFAFNTKDISKLKIGTKQFVKKDIKGLSNQLVEVIQQGKKLTLYKGYTTSVKEAKTNPMTLQKMGEDAILKHDAYFVESNSSIHKVKLKTSAILSFMEDENKEMKTFIKTNKLSVKEDADLAKIFIHYNSL